MCEESSAYSVPNTLGLGLVLRDRDFGFQSAGGKRVPPRRFIGTHMLEIRFSSVAAYTT